MCCLYIKKIFEPKLSHFTILKQFLLFTTFLQFILQNVTIQNYNTITILFNKCDKYLHQFKIVYVQK